MTFAPTPPLLWLAADLLGTAAVHAQECPPVDRQPITQGLIALLEDDPGLRNRL